MESGEGRPEKGERKIKKRKNEGMKSSADGRTENGVRKRVIGGRKV